MSKLTVWPELQWIAQKTARRFKLPFAKLTPITDRRARFHGAAVRLGGKWTGEIELRVHVLGRPTKPLSRRSLLRTLAHELAHLGGDRNHGSEQKELEQAILNLWRDEQWV